MSIKIDPLHVILIITTIVGLIRVMYDKVQYKCLLKASEMVARCEGYEDLTGEEKFTLCVKWLSESLPKVFRKALGEEAIGAIVQYVYDMAYQYMTRYIRRKTGLNVSALENAIKENKEED